MIPAKKFYMIRHGQSVANEAQYFSGNLDVELTDLGRRQAAQARDVVENLVDKPVRIVHSHLQRARHTAEIINQDLGLPISETPLLGEHHFGDWEKQPWDKIRPRFYAGENPPNGETHQAFAERICEGLNQALGKGDDPVLIASHGGVFRAFYCLYDNFKNFERIENCVLYEFTPNDGNPDFPWDVKAVR